MLSSSPDPFDECPGYYLPDFDPYKSCSNVSNFCAHARDVYNIEMLLRWAIFVIPCCLCFFALFLNIYIFWVLVPSLRKMNDRAKKKYVFILSRAISSTMSTISIFLLPAMIFLTHFNFWIIALFIIFEMLSFLSLLGGIAGTTLTIYVAVVHPVYYQREMSLRKCIVLLLLMWICAIIVAIGCGIIESAFVAKHAPFLCDYSSCAEPVLIFGIVCISTAFTLCLGTQFFVIFSLWRYERKSKKRGDYSSHQKAMTGVKRKLFGGFFVFGTMAVFEIASAIMLVNSVGSQDQDFNPCDMLEASGSRLQFVISCTVLTLLWTIGLFFDPIFTLTFDPLFSETLTRHDIHTSRLIFDWMGFYLSAGFFAISGVLNIYCLATAVFTYYYLSEEIRKHYVFVLSRCLSSILAVISLLIIQTILFTENFQLSFTFYAIAFSFYNFSMNSLLLSYIMVSVLTFFGVVHSNFYRQKVSLRSLYFTLGVIWIFSLSVAIPLSLYQAASSAPGGPIECDVEYCSKIIQWITFSFACITLFLTVFLTGFVVFSLYWYHFKAAKNGIQIPEVTNRARVRLTWTFFALIIFCFVELFPVGILIGYDRNNLEKCESFYNANKLLIQTVISSLETFLGSIIFMADPLINIFFDKNISKTVKLQDLSVSRSIRKWMGFYIPSVICFLAVLVDLYCLFITISLLRTLNEQTRKRYIFVVVRLSSAILVALCIILIQSIDFWNAPFQDSFTFYAVFFVVYDFSIFSLLGSFTGVAIMTYFGVMRPLFYRDRLTLKVMYIIAIGICIISACLSIPMGLFQAADTVDGPISCDSSSCQIIVEWLLFSLSCIILFGTTSTLLFVTISLYWHAYKSKKMGNLTSSPSDHGRARLAWTTAVLIILSSVELIPTGLLLAYGKLSISDDCDNFYRAETLVVPTMISCFETFMGCVLGERSNK